MENLTVWNYNNSEVRTVIIDNEPWWVLKDVCAVLEIQNHKVVSDRLEPDEVGRFELPHPQSKYKNIEMVCVNESGLYSVILRSDKPQAKPFRKWVTSEVLPAIRKTGEYKAKKSQSNPEFAKLRAEAMVLNAKNRVAKQMMALWAAAGVEPQYQALAMNDYYDGLSLPRIAIKEQATALFDLTTIAKHLGVMSKSGKPHAQAIGAIVEKLKPLNDDEWAMTPYSRNGHDDESIQYTESVEKKVADWLNENNHPAVIRNKTKNFSVTYRKQ